MTASPGWAVIEHLWLLHRLIFHHSWHTSVNMQGLNTLSRWCANLGAGDLFEATDKFKSEVSWRREGKYTTIELSSSKSH